MCFFFFFLNKDNIERTISSKILCLMFVYMYVLFYICVATEFIALTRMVLPVKCDLKCVFTNHRI